jgi:hypothetical protein
MIKRSNDILPKEARLLDEKRNVTSRISDTCRFVGFGLLAIYYSIKIGGNKLATQLQTEHRWLVFWLGLFGALAILLDYLQFVAGSLAVNKALRSAGLEYDTDWCSYKFRQLAFNAKQFVVLAGVAVLLWLIGTLEFAPSPARLAPS